MLDCLSLKMESLRCLEKPLMIRCNIPEDFLKSVLLICNILIRTETRVRRQSNFFFSGISVLRIAIKYVSIVKYT
jgi:hypothetical protein